jgi:MSHA biogenesis protein MshJ
MNMLLTKYQRIIDQLPTIKKSVILAAFFGLTFIVWYYGLWQNLRNSTAATVSKIEVIRSYVRETESQLEPMEKELKARKEMYDKNISSAASNSTTITLLSPQQKSDALYDILTSNNSLVLLQLKNMPPKEVLLSQTNSKIFEHGIVIKFLGDYFSVMKYLQAIEKLKWEIFWDKLEYKVTKYPMAEITLYIHTISNAGNSIHA